MTEQFPLHQAQAGLRPDRRGLTQWLALGLLLICAGLAVRFWLQREPVNSDDSEYFILSTYPLYPTASDGRRVATSHTSARIAFRAPLRIAVRVLGASITAFYAIVYLNAFLSGLAIFAFSTVVARRRVAAVVMVLWATSPVWIEVDTRLVPDNFGTALSLLGLTAILCAGGLAPIARGAARPAGGRQVWLLGLIGGLLLWAAWSTRASFVAFSFAGLLVACLSQSRRRLVAATLAGLACGLCLEGWYFLHVYGDPFARLRLLAGYGNIVSEVSVFQGYTLEAMLLRYPRLIAGASKPEYWLHVIGMFGVVFWAVRWRDRRNLAKLFVWLFGYGMIAYACVRLSPPVPLMREKLRYYAVASPLFYLAAADLFVFVMAAVSRTLRERHNNAQSSAVRRLILRSCRTCLVASGVLLVSLTVYRNLGFASSNPSLVRNGKSALLDCADAIRNHQQRSNARQFVYTDTRTGRVLMMLLPKSEGWKWQGFHKLGGSVPGDGYVVLNWQRLNANVHYDYPEAHLTHELNDFAKSHPILIRHRNGAALTDVFVVGDKPQPRPVRDITNSAAAQWSFLPHGGKTSEPVSGALQLQNKGILHTGEEQPWIKPDDSRSLPSGRLVEMHVNARADETGRMRGRLYCWRAGEKKPIQLYMGQSYVRTESTSIVFWTWLSEPATAYRLALQNVDGAPIRIQDVTVKIYESLPGDVMQPAGGAW